MSRKERVKTQRKQFVTFADIAYMMLAFYIMLPFLPSVIHHFKETTEIISPVRKVDAQMYPIILMTPTPTPVNREVKLSAYLKLKNSPLAPYSHLFITLADQYGIDYTLMPAISGKESSFGVNLPEGSFNPFGLGGSNFMWFASWQDSITYEAKLLSNDYRWNATHGIQQKYCPDSDNCSPSWTDDVTSFSQEIINQ